MEDLMTRLVMIVGMFAMGWGFCELKHCGMMSDALAFISDPEVRNADKKPREEFFYFYKYCPCSSDLLFFSVNAFGQREADRLASVIYATKILAYGNTLEKTFEPSLQRTIRTEATAGSKTIRFHVE
ncbi:hypothetical protein ACFL08_01020 [Patescibacteria group bacterium]